MGRRIEDSRTAFCRQEYPRLVGSLRLYTGDGDLACELAQEALARACAHWDRVERMDAPGAWVHRVGVNLARSRFRRRRYERIASERHANEREIPHTDPTTRVALREALLRLPERQRLALVLRFWADLPVDRAADVMGCRPGTVRALTHQGLAALRAALADPQEVEPWTT